MEERDKKGRTADGVRLDVDIKDLIAEIEQLLMKMNETLRKQAKDKKVSLDFIIKKYPEASTQQKQKMYDNLR